jgi:hypothetical protein
MNHTKLLVSFLFTGFNNYFAASTKYAYSENETLIYCFCF